jgi:hypothetical protein
LKRHDSKRPLYNVNPPPNFQRKEMILDGQKSMRFFFFLVYAVLLSGLTACGGDNGDGGESNTGSYHAELVFPSDIPRVESEEDGSEGVDCEKAGIAAINFSFTIDGAPLKTFRFGCRERHAQLSGIPVNANILVEVLVYDLAENLILRGSTVTTIEAGKLTEGEKIVLGYTDADPLDSDRDGYPVPEDCDDNNAEVHPGAEEIPGNNIDENCDGNTAQTANDPDAYYPGDGSQGLLGPRPIEEFDSELNASSNTIADCDPCVPGTLTIAGGGFAGMEGRRVHIFSFPAYSETDGPIDSEEFINGDPDGFLWSVITADGTFQNSRNPGQPFSLVPYGAEDIFSARAALTGGTHQIVFVMDNDPESAAPRDRSQVEENDFITSRLVTINGDTFFSVNYDDLRWLPFFPIEDDDSMSEQEESSSTPEQESDSEQEQEDAPPTLDPEDMDNDGDGLTENQGDCNDNNRNISPRTAEVCGNNIDENCDGRSPACPRDIDNDGDGLTENQGDCNDANRNISPRATEICGNAVDENCDGLSSDCMPKNTALGFSDINIPSTYTQVVIMAYRGGSSVCAPFTRATPIGYKVVNVINGGYSNIIVGRSDQNTIPLNLQDVVSDTFVYQDFSAVLFYLNSVIGPAQSWQVLKDLLTARLRGGDLRIGQVRNFSLAIGNTDRVIVNSNFGSNQNFSLSECN